MCICQNAYIKLHPENKMDMIFCRRFDDEPDVNDRLCLRQRFCTNKNKYVFLNETQCKYFKNKYTL